MMAMHPYDTIFMDGKCHEYYNVHCNWTDNKWGVTIRVHDLMAHIPLDGLPQVPVETEAFYEAHVRETHERMQQEYGQRCLVRDRLAGLLDASLA